MRQVQSLIILHYLQFSSNGNDRFIIDSYQIAVFGHIFHLVWL